MSCFHVLFDHPSKLFSRKQWLICTLHLHQCHTAQAQQTAVHIFKWLMLLLNQEFENYQMHLAGKRCIHCLNDILLHTGSSHRVSVQSIWNNNWQKFSYSMSTWKTLPEIVTVWTYMFKGKVTYNWTNIRERKKEHFFSFFLLYIEDTPSVRKRWKMRNSGKQKT